MKNLALAAICGMFRFEFVTEEDVDPDTAVDAMEEIFFHLRNATAAEKQALIDAAIELKAEAKNGDRKNKKELEEFYDNFLQNLDEDSASE